jgi:hypothetical protein
MATWDDVRRIALALPETAEGTTFDNQAWLVKGKSFVWRRPLNKADVKRWGTATPIPDGPILAAYVADLDEKDALVTEEPDLFFTIEHFNGFRAVLIRLDAIDPDRLEDVITDAWLARAPKRVVADFLDARSDT